VIIIFIYSISNPFVIDGKINDVSIFDYALSSSQVTTLWGGGTSVSNPMALPSPPIAYYPLGKSAYNGQYLAENNAIGDYVFDFSGSNDITVPHNSTLDQSVYSFSFWINNNLNSGVSNDGIITADSSTRGWSILQDNQTFKFNPNISGGSGQINVTNFFNATSTWIHCAITFDGTNLIVYKNGTSVGSSSSGTRNLNSNNNPLTIGNNTFASGRFFNGKLSNVQIFNSALSGPEVETLYNYGSPIQTLANIPQNSNLKAWYKLDASEVYNSTSTEWSIDNNQNPSAYSSSLSFDSASSDKITGTGALISGNDSRTISLWYKTTTTAAQIPFSLGSPTDQTNGAQFAYCINRNSTTTAAIFGKNSSYDTSAFTVPYTSDGKWHHLSVTYNQSSLNVYIDGNLVASPSLPSLTYLTSAGFTIGGWTIVNNRKFNGFLSNISVWNTALTDGGVSVGSIAGGQIAELYNNGTPSNLSSHSATSNLVSWWKLNNTTTGIEDAKGSNNGTNNGTTEYPGFVSKTAGESSGMSQAILMEQMIILL